MAVQLAYVRMESPDKKRCTISPRRSSDLSIYIVWFGELGLCGAPICQGSSQIVHTQSSIPRKGLARSSYYGWAGVGGLKPKLRK
jgi:hypothetical protein